MANRRDSYNPKYNSDNRSGFDPKRSDSRNDNYKPYDSHRNNRPYKPSPQPQPENKPNPRFYGNPADAADTSSNYPAYLRKNGEDGLGPIPPDSYSTRHHDRRPQAEKLMDTFKNFLQSGVDSFLETYQSSQFNNGVPIPFTTLDRIRGMKLDLPGNYSYLDEKNNVYIICGHCAICSKVQFTEEERQHERREIEDMEQKRKIAEALETLVNCRKNLNQTDIELLTHELSSTNISNSGSIPPFDDDNLSNSSDL